MNYAKDHRQDSNYVSVNSLIHPKKQSGINPFLLHATEEQKRQMLKTDTSLSATLPQEEIQTFQEKLIGNTTSDRTIQKKENKTGMPDDLNTGVENLSGIDMSDVKVHYNSDKPAQIGALAYTQGTDIHVAMGQEQHLPHEAWHVVQQKRGRVKPTMQLKGEAVNDDVELEREADVMGGKSFQFIDNRSDAIAQNKLQVMMNIRPETKQLIASQKADNSYQSKNVIILQQNVSNQAVLQRYGGVIGKPGIYVLCAKTVLFHGSNVERFTDNKLKAPAWLTADPAFAMHAVAQMHPSPKPFLHNFTVMKEINLLAFDDCKDLETYLESLKKNASGGNIGMDAKGVKELNPHIEGYMIEKDLGRGQPEYVLFDSGILKLKAGEPIPFDEKEEGESRVHYLYGERWGVLEPQEGEKPPAYSL